MNCYNSLILLSYVSTKKSEMRRPKQLSLSQLLDHNQTDPVLSDTGCGEKKRRNHTSNAVN